MGLSVTRSQEVENKYFNPLSQEGGVDAIPLPFRIFPRAVFALSLKIDIRSIYLPFVQLPMFLRK